MNKRFAVCTLSELIVECTEQEDQSRRYVALLIDITNANKIFVRRPES